MSKPTKERISTKEYRCLGCGNIENHQTNHYGKIYNTRCQSCLTFQSFECCVPCPAHMQLPEEWTMGTLADLDDPEKVDPEFAKYYKEFLAGGDYEEFFTGGEV